MALPGDFRIGILDRRHRARDTGGDDGVGTGRRPADMRAWLKRYIKRGAARSLAGALECLGLRVWTAARLRPAAADHDAVLDHDRADGRVRAGSAPPPPPERQRQLHKAPISGLRFPGFLRELVFQNPEDHLRNRAIRASSSPESSPSTASKSLASRKLR